MRLLALLLLILAGCGSRAETVRFATFNSSLSREAPGELLAALRTPDDPKAKAVAAIIQAARPDVLLLQEFDHGGGYDPGGEALRLFQQNYLGVAQQDDLEPIAYEHVYLAPSNTGVPTGLDLNGDGLVAPCEGAEVGTPAYAADCHGYGLFPGQYAFAVLSKYPIDREGIRTFRELLWKDLPGNHVPPGYYSEEALAVLRLSSKNHVDVPIEVGGETIHVLAAHPTPPVFDGPEDRNGRRNFDEISLLSDFLLWMLTPTNAPFAEMSWCGNCNDSIMRSKAGQKSFVILGDLNADPHDGDSLDFSALQPQELRDLSVEAGWRLGSLHTLAPLSSRVPPESIHVPYRDLPLSDVASPTSPGGVAAAERDGGANANHQSDPADDTADWNDGPGGPGNLRVDYVLPSNDLAVLGGGVFWPTPDQPLMGVDLATVERASDHRLVWVDVRLP